MKTIAIIGRPNVGKSTLFNRLTGTNHALVHNQPGVTRDRRESPATLHDLTFNIMDTAGLDHAADGTLTARMTEQSVLAAKDADVVLFVVDARAGILPEDESIAQDLRKLKKPIIVVANKCEGREPELLAADAWRLGLGAPIPVSAAHGEGLRDLYQSLAPHFGVKIIHSDEEELEPAPIKKPRAPAKPPINEADDPDEMTDDDVIVDKKISVAIVGRPNAGKSTLINRLVGEERLLTGPEAGITRDSIIVPFTWKTQDFLLADTAGLRKRRNVQEEVEAMAGADTRRALSYAQVCILVVDAQEPLEKQDNTIAQLIEEEGRALIFAVNKWDLVPDKPAWTKALRQRVQNVMPQMGEIAIMPVSALNGEGMDALMREVSKTYERWNSRISTGALNRWLDAATTKHTPPLIKSRRLKLRYITQAKSRPPTFTLFANMTDVPDVYLRYLNNSLREEFGLEGVPLRFRLKKSNNPYANKPKDKK